MPYLINNFLVVYKFKNTLAFLLKFGIVRYMVTITPQKVFFVHLVVYNYIFAMPVAVSDTGWSMFNLWYLTPSCLVMFNLLYE